jgi:ubiquinone/menaquinone biosynthesis C-methylase UbiE
LTTAISRLRDELTEHTRDEFRRDFGDVESDWVASAAEYFWNEAHQDARVADLYRWGFRPGTARVLDLAGGHGQFVFRALEAGFDAYGVEPDVWKLGFAARKLAVTGRPRAWSERLLRGVGEALPFADDTFDCVSSYQTLEHVQDPGAVLAEMVRVTRPGGGVHLRCPDYRSTFEAHYRLPWLPYFPRAVARAYLRAFSRPTRGLDSIQYVTAPRIRRWLSAIEKAEGCRLIVVNGDQVGFADAVRRAGLPDLVSDAFFLYRTWAFVGGAFRREASVNLFVRILSKESTNSRDAVSSPRVVGRQLPTGGVVQP